MSVSLKNVMIKRLIEERKTVPYNKGREESIVAFVFACPGQEELNNGRVVSGQTGKNLDTLLRELNAKCSSLFKYINRYDYLITNASEKVYYKGYHKSKRTLPYLYGDVYTEENLNRLKTELTGKNIIITFGKHSKKAIKKLRIQGKIIVSKNHLGMQGINHIKKDIGGNIIPLKDEEATNKRIQVIAEQIINECKN